MATKPLVRVRPAIVADAGELLTLQLAAFVSEAQRYGDPLIPPLREGLAGVERVIADPSRTVLTAECTSAADGGRVGRLLGSAQLRITEDGARRVGQVGRVVVAPDVQGRGIGSLLLRSLHDVAASVGGLQRLELFTGAGSERNLELYRRNGYRDADVITDDRGVRLQVMHREVDPADPRR